MGILQSRPVELPLDDIEYTNTLEVNNDVDKFLTMQEFEESVVLRTGLRPNWMKWKLFFDCASKHQDLKICDELKISKIDYMIMFYDASFDTS